MPSVNITLSPEECRTLVRLLRAEFERWNLDTLYLDAPNERQEKERVTRLHAQLSKVVKS